MKMNAFIDKVRRNPCLWDSSHIMNRDMAEKELAWERIAMECGMADGREAKWQFKKLRDSHREALRRRKFATGQAGLVMKPWKYEADMAFLLPQTENTTTVTHTDDADDSAQYPVPLDTTDNETESLEVPLESLEEGSRKRKRGVIENVIEAERERREQKQHRTDLRRQIEVPRKDALTNLFDSMCQKTRDLPKHLQLRVQREIFESVTRAEEEALDPSLNPTSTYFSPTSSTSSYEYANARSQLSPLSGSVVNKAQSVSADVKTEKIDYDE